VPSPVQELDQCRIDDVVFKCPISIAETRAAILAGFEQSDRSPERLTWSDTRNLHSARDAEQELSILAAPGP